MYAAYYGHAGVVRALCDAKCDINLQGSVRIHTRSHTHTHTHTHTQGWGFDINVWSFILSCGAKLLGNSGSCASHCISLYLFSTSLTIGQTNLHARRRTFVEKGEVVWQIELHVAVASRGAVSDLWSYHVATHISRGVYFRTGTRLCTGASTETTRSASPSCCAAAPTPTSRTRSASLPCVRMRVGRGRPEVGKG